MTSLNKTPHPAIGLPLVPAIAAVLSLIFNFATPANAGHHAEAEENTIIDVAVAAGDFNTLAAALDAAGLVDVLRGDGPFTVFAPNDAAFAKLPEGTVESLLKPENKEKLIAVLTYHVVPGTVTSGEVIGMSSAKTVNGQEISIQATDGRVKIDNASVTAVDVMASNGVIHIIDQVIVPN